MPNRKVILLPGLIISIVWCAILAGIHGRKSCTEVLYPNLRLSKKHSGLKSGSRGDCNGYGCAAMAGR